MGILLHVYQMHWNDNKIQVYLSFFVHTDFKQSFVFSLTIWKKKYTVHVIAIHNKLTWYKTKGWKKKTITKILWFFLTTKTCTVLKTYYNNHYWSQHDQDLWSTCTKCIMAHDSHAVFHIWTRSIESDATNEQVWSPATKNTTSTLKFKV